MVISFTSVHDTRILILSPVICIHSSQPSDIWTMQCAFLVTCQITLCLGLLTIPQPDLLPAFGSISTHFVTPPILVTGTPVFSPFPHPPATSPGR